METRWNPCKRVRRYGVNLKCSNDVVTRPLLTLGESEKNWSPCDKVGETCEFARFIGTCNRRPQESVTVSGGHFVL